MSNLVEDAQLNEQVKQLIIDKLIKDGYGTYAKRLKEFKFFVTSMHRGAYIDTAAMFFETGDIVINPAFLDLSSVRSNRDAAKSDDEIQLKALDQLSVLLRHELLHYLLVHELRFKEHLQQVDKDFEKDYKRASIHELANYAMDYDISNKGYDDYDLAVVRNMTLNGKVIGGLIAEDDHPEWLELNADGVTKSVKKSMEEMFDILKSEFDKQPQGKNGKPVINIVEDNSASQEYVDTYNRIIQTYNDAKYSDAELSQLIIDINNGKDI